MLLQIAVTLKRFPKQLGWTFLFQQKRQHSRHIHRNNIVKGDKHKPWESRSVCQTK